MNDLSLDYINAKSPYLVKRADDGDYVFQTAKGVIYGIGFIENDPLGGCETYQLSISNQNKLHASYDPDVKIPQRKLSRNTWDWYCSCAIT